MKKYIEKFKNIFPDKNKRVAIFFVFYFIFFICLFIFAMGNNNSNTNNSKCPVNNKDEVVKTDINYGFRYEINMNGNEIVLSGSRYDNREKIDKRVEGVLTKYYIYYSDIYIFNENSEWIKSNNKIIEGFDEKLINLDYISELVETGEIQSDTNKKIVYYNADKNITIEKIYNNSRKLDSIKVIDGTTIVILRYFDKGKIEKFDIITKD